MTVQNRLFRYGTWVVFCLVVLIILCLQTASIASNLNVLFIITGGCCSYRDDCYEHDGHEFCPWEIGHKYHLEQAGFHVTVLERNKVTADMDLSGYDLVYCGSAYHQVDIIIDLLLRYRVPFITTERQFIEEWKLGYHNYDPNTFVEGLTSLKVDKSHLMFDEIGASPEDIVEVYSNPNMSGILGVLDLSLDAKEIAYAYDNSTGVVSSFPAIIEFPRNSRQSPGCDSYYSSCPDPPK